MLYFYLREAVARAWCLHVLDIHRFDFMFHQDLLHQVKRWVNLSPYYRIIVGWFRSCIPRNPDTK